MTTVRLPLLLALALVSPEPAPGQTPDAALQAEIRKIDTAAADPDGRLAVVGAMAERLNVHRNHLVLLRRQTGQSYGRIFVSELKSAGRSPEAILAEAQALNGEIENRWRGAEDREAGLVPILSVSAGVDHNSAGAFYSLRPEVGVGSGPAALVLGVPFYRNSPAELPAAQGSIQRFSAGGIGDVYTAGFLRGHVARCELGSSLTVGFPTGDHLKGLGAGKVTVDVAGMVAGNLERFRPFVSAGFANSVFSNVGYQRPYITDGNAAYFSGGLELQLARRLRIGAGGFAVRPSGEQVVYSRVIPGRRPGGQTPPGRSDGSTKPPKTPVYEIAPLTTSPASELQDHGANAWVSVALHRAASLNLAVARSVPFQLTTVRVGLSFDIARLF